MSHQLADLSIGDLAEAAGVNVETIRFYQRKGLVAKPGRQHGEIRRYAGRDVARVKFIKAAQRLGFSLEETAALMKLDDGKHCHEARVLAEERLGDVRSRLSALRQMEAALETIVTRCSEAKGAVTCPLIASLLPHDE